MKSKSPPAIHYQLNTQYESIRSKLLGNKTFQDRLDKPLAYWALASDRRLPFALLNYKLRDLLKNSFEQLETTSSIGQKKIVSLLDLLNRALQDTVTGDLPSSENSQIGTEKTSHTAIRDLLPDPQQVSEALWVLWRESVMLNGLAKEPLGRFAPSLQDIPRVLWNAPLETYAHLTLKDIRSLKTYGEKRIHSMLEIFGSLHAILSRQSPQSHLAINIEPRLIGSIQTWVLRVLEGNTPPSREEIRLWFILPILEQIRVDAGEIVSNLVEEQLGLTSQTVTVRQTAKRMGLTRARIYQLFDDVEKILQVRWPQGAVLSKKLIARMEQTSASNDALTLLRSAQEIFFPRDAEKKEASAQVEISSQRTFASKKNGEKSKPVNAVLTKDRTFSQVY